MKQYLSIFKKLFIALVSCILIGFILMTSVYCLPTGRMVYHLSESSPELRDPKMNTMSWRSGGRLDILTDSWMMLIAAEPRNHSVVKSAMLNEYSNVEGLDITESLQAIYGDRKNESSLEITRGEYSRYWHGYLTVLKPLLLFFSYGQIRSLNMIVQFGLFSFLCMMFARNNRSLMIIPTAFFWLFLNPVTTILSMQFSGMVILVFIQLILFQVFEEKYNQSPFLLLLHFLIFGALTSFIDLLTYPLVTLGVPLLFHLVTQSYESVKSSLQTVLKCGFTWGIGYAGMWIGKWIVGSIVTMDFGVLGHGIYSMRVRGGNAVDGAKVTFFEVLDRVFKATNTDVLCFAIFLMAFIILIRFVKKEKIISVNSYALPAISIVAVLPIIWFAVLANHSYIHNWFAYRNLGVTVFALFILFLNCDLQTSKNKS